jgi:hypothetical protein
MWDLEVDVAVIGAGIGGLANAIAAVDAGGEVLVANAVPERSAVPATSAVPETSAVPGARSVSSAQALPGYSPIALRERVATARGWLLRDTLDLETGDYLAAVGEDIPDSAIDPGDGAVPRRSARNLSTEEAFRRPVETFVGARLTGWAAQCVASPYGLLYTSMRDWRSTTMKSANGESIEALSIGAIDWADGFGDGALRQWLTAEALKRDIEVEAETRFERIVFEEGVIAGVVLSTEDGPLAVRTRAGITFAPSDHATGADGHVGVPEERLQVCLVGRTASRFGRVELLDTEPAAPSRPTCTGSRRQVRDGLHDARQQALEGWRCGKVHGYPSLGQ